MPGRRQLSARLVSRSDNLRDSVRIGSPPGWKLHRFPSGIAQRPGYRSSFPARCRTSGIAGRVGWPRPNRVRTWGWPGCCYRMVSKRLLVGLAVAQKKKKTSLRSPLSRKCRPGYPPAPPVKLPSCSEASPDASQTVPILAGRRHQAPMRPYAGRLAPPTGAPESAASAMLAAGSRS